MSLGLLELQKTCKRKDGCLEIEIITANGVCDKPRSGIYCLLAITVPYACDKKVRAADKGKRLAERKATEHLTKTTQIDEATCSPSWRESYEFYLKNLSTMNFLHVEVWAHKKMGKDRFLGCMEVPISNSFIGSRARETWYPLSLPASKGPDLPVGDLQLKLRLTPPCTGIEKIALSGERFPEVPVCIFESFWVPRYLIELVLQDCSIETVSDQIGDLPILAVLSLRDNKLKKLPTTIGRLTNLKKLDMSYNQLESLPDELENLTLLSTAYFMENQIQTYPEVLCRLPAGCDTSISFEGRNLTPSEEMVAAAEVLRAKEAEEQQDSQDAAAEKVAEESKADDELVGKEPVIEKNNDEVPASIETEEIDGEKVDDKRASKDIPAETDEINTEETVDDKLQTAERVPKVGEKAEKAVDVAEDNDADGQAESTHSLLADTKEKTEPEKRDSALDRELESAADLDDLDNVPVMAKAEPKEEGSPLSGDGGSTSDSVADAAAGGMEKGKGDKPVRSLGLEKEEGKQRSSWTAAKSPRHSPRGVQKPNDQTVADDVLAESNGEVAKPLKEVEQAGSDETTLDCEQKEDVDDNAVTQTGNAAAKSDEGESGEKLLQADDEPAASKATKETKKEKKEREKREKKEKKEREEQERKDKKEKEELEKKEKREKKLREKQEKKEKEKQLKEEKEKEKKSKGKKQKRESKQEDGANDEEVNAENGDEKDKAAGDVTDGKQETEETTTVPDASDHNISEENELKKIEDEDEVKNLEADNGKDDETSTAPSAPSSDSEKVQIPDSGAHVDRTATIRASAMPSPGLDRKPVLELKAPSQC